MVGQSQRQATRWSPAQTWLLALVAVPSLLIVGFAVHRVVTDVGHLRAGTLPGSPTDLAYVQHPWPAYAHIVPALLYLAGAPWQLSYRIRRRHYDLHRRLGRVLVGAGLLCAGFAIGFGLRYPVGGLGEGLASATFGLWMITCLILAVRAIRSRDTTRHRAWMIRAYAVAIGVGTIRIWVLLLWGTHLMDLRGAFAWAFWVGLTLHALLAEAWLRLRSGPPDSTVRI